MFKGTEQKHRALVISAMGINQILAWGSSYYLPAVLAHPIADSTGWSYAWVVAGVSFGLLVAGLVVVRLGRIIDQYGGRPVLVSSSILMALGHLILAVAPNIQIYFLAWMALGIGMGAGLYDATFSTLGRLYGTSARSAITNLALWGGFASTVCWPFSAFLVENLGWRGTCLVYAGLHLCLTLPLYLFVVPKEAKSKDEAAAAPQAVNASPIRPLSHPAFVFVLLSIILMIGGTVSVMWSFHLIGILQSRGLELAVAVGLGALVGPAQVGSRVVERIAGNRYHPIWTLSAAVFLITTGLALLWMGIPVPALALISYGAGNGIWSVARGTLPLALFGASGYAVLMGRLAMPSLIAQSMAPMLGALLMEDFGGTGMLAVMTGMGLLNVCGVLGLWLATRSSHGDNPTYPRS